MTPEEAIRLVVEYMIYPLLNEYDIGLWERIDYIPLADEWVCNVRKCRSNKEIKENLSKWILESIGAKNDKYRWHDLRKNPEDLPEEFERVLVWHEYYHWSQEKVLPEYGIGYACCGKLCGEITQGRDVKLIAWRYIEPFEEDDK